MNRALLAIFLLTLAPTAMAGKNFIAGQVLDRNGEPIDRAILTLKPGNVQLVTDREGKFLIDYLRDEQGERKRLGKKTDYILEVFKPGFHIAQSRFFFKSKGLALESITLVEDTIAIEDDGANIDPARFEDNTQSTGATYEGQ